MTRLQYLNRKIEGIKLGQVVAKDILKRIPPGLSSKSARRDPVIELDVSSKDINDEATAAVCEALVRCVSHPEGNTKLEELRLRDNKITASSLIALAQVVRASSSDLQDLDLSSNLISIQTDTDVSAWEDFLKSFRNCYMLRRLDLSGNSLGAKAFEVLARIYIKEEPEIAHDGLIDFGERDVDAGLISNNTRLGSTEKQAESRVPVDARIRCMSRTGLRSIPYIDFSNCAMREDCALYLSYMIERHESARELMNSVLPAKQGDHARQLEAYDAVDGCDGIMWRDNEQLSEAGIKVLQLAERRRTQLDQETDNGALESTANISSPSTHKKSSENTTSPFTPLISRTNRNRRDSASTANSTPQAGNPRSMKSDPMRSARSRIQGNILRDSGPASNHLWRGALRMLGFTRPILATESPPSADAGEQGGEPPTESTTPVTPTLDDKASLAIREINLEPHPLSITDKAWPRLVSKQPEAVLSGKGAAVLKLSTVKRESEHHPGKRRTSRTSKLEAGGGVEGPPKQTPPQAKPMLVLPERTYRTSLPQGFGENVWGRIAAYASGVESILTDEQCTQIVGYARQRQTLRREIETLGKPESTQIWKALDGMGCLAYS